jgi:hypothetical protein
MLVGQCVATIFETMRPFCLVATLIEDPTPVENKFALIWAVFQSHRVMEEEFIRVGFKRHPAIVKQMCLFMVTEQVDLSEILGIMTKVSKVEAAADKATAGAKKHGDNYTKLNEAFGAQMPKLDALAKHFDTFKNKVNVEVF